MAKVDSDTAVSAVPSAPQIPAIAVLPVYHSARHGRDGRVTTEFSPHAIGLPSPPHAAWQNAFIDE
jgi:hypothetical protein